MLVGHNLSAGDEAPAHHSNAGPIVCKIGTGTSWLAFTQFGGAILCASSTTYTLVQEHDNEDRPTQNWGLYNNNDEKLCCGPGIYELSAPE
jgi:hypothetical protein